MPVLPRRRRKTSTRKNRRPAGRRRQLRHLRGTIATDQPPPSSATPRPGASVGLRGVDGSASPASTVFPDAARRRRRRQRRRWRRRSATTVKLTEAWKWLPVEVSCGDSCRRTRDGTAPPGCTDTIHCCNYNTRTNTRSNQ